eukprot:scaffold11373_cov160-Skeletonema_marinoi.AAC.2
MNLLTNKSCIVHKLAGSLLLPSQILYTAESQVTRHGQTAYKFPAAVPLFTLAFILSFPSTHRLNQNVYEMPRTRGCYSSNNLADRVGSPLLFSTMKRQLSNPTAGVGRLNNRLSITSFDTIRQIPNNISSRLSMCALKQWQQTSHAGRDCHK